MVKYKQCYQDMIDTHKQLFDEFAKIHEKYEKDPQTWQETFNDIGDQVQQVIRKYERILCGHSEASKYGKFSTNLSEKFWGEIRKDFPKIDFIGTIYS